MKIRSEKFGSQLLRTFEKDAIALELIGSGRLTVTDSGTIVLDGQSRPEHPCPNGYLRCELPIDGEWVRFRCHRIAALYHFGAPPSSGQAEVNHLDGVRSNNRRVNLCWTSRKGNMQQVRRQPYNLTTPQERLEIRRLAALGESIGAIARRVGCGHPTAKYWAEPDRDPLTQRRFDVVYDLRSPSGKRFRGRCVEHLATLVSESGTALRSVVAGKHRRTRSGWTRWPAEQAVDQQLDKAA